MNTTGGKAARDPEIRGLAQVVEQLRRAGIEAGEQEAEQLRAQARTQAEQVLAAAQAEAQRVTEAAQVDATARRQRLDAELRQAAKVGVLAFRQALERAVLVPAVRDHVARALEDPTVVGALLGEAVRGMATSTTRGADLQVVLPPATAERLSATVLADAARRLGEGVQVRLDEATTAGFMVRAQGVRLDVTDEALEQVLRGLVSPRFRAELFTQGGGA